MRIGLLRRGWPKIRAHVPTAEAERMVLSGRFAYGNREKSYIFELAVPNPPSNLAVHYIPKKLPPAEVGGCHFVLPQSALVSATSVLRLVRIRAREIPCLMSSN